MGFASIPPDITKLEDKMDDLQVEIEQNKVLNVRVAFIIAVISVLATFLANIIFDIVFQNEYKTLLMFLTAILLLFAIILLMAYIEHLSKVRLPGNTNAPKVIAGELPRVTKNDVKITLEDHLRKKNPKGKLVITDTETKVKMYFTEYILKIIPKQRVYVRLGENSPLPDDNPNIRVKIGWTIALAGATSADSLNNDMNNIFKLLNEKYKDNNLKQY